MSKDDKNMEIATFRFGVIADFVTGVHLDYGDKERLIREKLCRRYKIPYSHKTRITRSTLMNWVTDYKKAGCRIEGLMPRTRKDKGDYRSLDASLQLAIKEIKREKPKLTGPALITELKHKKVIGSADQISLSVLYRFLEAENLLKPADQNLEDRRAFEASLPNELWQSDILHGPYVQHEGRKRKAYLIAILDDYSRLITHAEFYLSEKLADFKNCLKKAIEKRGLPQKLYTDNGSCYCALNVEQITACLGIALKKARPYKPQGKGKIERWFLTVRQSFLPHLTERLSLPDLNERLENWVEEYHNKVHCSTKQTPLERYKAKLQCVRPAPPNLFDYFRIVQFRRVKKDRTFKLNGCSFEAPVALIDQQIELRFHQEFPDDVEIFLEGKSFGKAQLLDKNVNFKIGRNYRVTTEKDTDNKPPSGKLFK